MPQASYVAAKLDDSEDVTASEREEQGLTGMPSAERGPRTNSGTYARVVALGLASLALAGMAYKFAMSEGHREFFTPSSMAVKTGGKVCLTHVSYGSKFQEINDLTVPVKEAYAKRWGYEAKVYVRDTFMELVDMDFKKCMHGNIKDPEAFDKQSLLKFCGIWAAFDDGCDTVLFTDGDAVIASPDIKVEYWLEQDPAADVYWSLNDPTTASYCTENGASIFKGDGPDGLSMFGTCLNSGTFIIRKNRWTLKYLHRLLLLSNHTIRNHCSTRSLNPEGFDQCDFKVMGRETTPGQSVTQTKVGDQCVIACDAMEHKDDLHHFVSFGPHQRPVFQFVQTQPSGLFKMFHYRPWKNERAYVVNCAGHLVKDQKINCVKMHAGEAGVMDS